MSPRPPLRPPTRPAMAAALLVPAAIAGALGIGLSVGTSLERARQPWARERFISAAIDSVRNNALDSLPEPELLKRAVSGMLRELNDPYAALLESDGATHWREGLRGVADGLGMQSVTVPEGHRVMQVTRGSPAAGAGLRPGDLVFRWRRESDALVTAYVRHPGATDTVAVTVRRDQWKRPLIEDAALLPGRLGYVRVPTMAEGTTAALAEVVQRLVTRGASRLVIDLRGNRGGLVDEGVDAASLFLVRGELVATLEARDAVRETYRSRDGRWAALPLTVLVDGGTASSAELFAAALRDHGRAALVGEATYGKPHVQRLVGLTGDLSLRLTTAQWHRPSGEAIPPRTVVKGVVTGGVTPDILIPAEQMRDVGATRLGERVDGARIAAAVDAVTEVAIAARHAILPDSLLTDRVRAALDSALPSDVVLDSARLAATERLHARSAAAVRSRALRTVRGEARAALLDTLAAVTVARVVAASGSTDRRLQRQVTADAALREAALLLSPQIAIGAFVRP